VPRLKPLIDPTIIAVAIEQHETFFLRAIVVHPDPGAGYDVVLERIDYGDEAEPFRISKHGNVAYDGSRPAELVFRDGYLHITETDEYGPPRTYSVPARAEDFGTKAVKQR
jgi:hypothetical protein